MWRAGVRARGADNDISFSDSRAPAFCSNTIDWSPRMDSCIRGVMGRGHMLLVTHSFQKAQNQSPRINVYWRGCYGQGGPQSRCLPLSHGLVHMLLCSHSDQPTCVRVCVFICVCVCVCTQTFVDVEYLDGSESYKCEACKCARPHTKRLQIYRPPHALVLTLKRFSQRSSAGFFSRFRCVLVCVCVCVRARAFQVRVCVCVCVCAFRIHHTPCTKHDMAHDLMCLVPKINADLFVCVCRSTQKNNAAVHIDVDCLDLTPYCNPTGLQATVRTHTHTHTHTHTQTDTMHSVFTLPFDCARSCVVSQGDRHADSKWDTMRHVDPCALLIDLTHQGASHALKCRVPLFTILYCALPTHGFRVASCLLFLCLSTGSEPAHVQSCSSQPPLG